MLERFELFYGIQCVLPSPSASPSSNAAKIINGFGKEITDFSQQGNYWVALNSSYMLNMVDIFRRWAREQNMFLNRPVQTATEPQKAQQSLSVGPYWEHPVIQLAKWLSPSFEKKCRHV